MRQIGPALAVKIMESGSKKTSAKPSTEKPNLIFCLIETLRRIEEEPGLADRVQWDELEREVEGILFSTDVRLFTSHSKAAELRVVFESWINAQLERVNPALLKEAKSYRVKDIGNWEKRIQTAKNAPGGERPADSIGLALHHIDIARELMNHAHHMGMRHHLWQGDSGRRALGQLIMNICLFAEKLAKRPPSKRMADYIDFDRREIQEGRFIVLRKNSGTPLSAMACLEQGSWCGTLSFDSTRADEFSKLAEGDTVYLSGLTMGDGTPFCGADSLLVHHPDYMLTVTDLTECYPGYIREGLLEGPRPMHVIKSHFAPRGPSRHNTVVGQLVNILVDRALHCKNEGRDMESERNSMVLDALSERMLDLATLPGDRDFEHTVRDLKNESAPQCPDHNLQMVLRSSRNGQFYGCPRFPECRRTAGIKDHVGYRGLNDLLIPRIEKERGKAYWEVPVYSPRLGLTGKIDILFQPTGDARMLKFIELKTGKVYGRSPEDPNYLNPQHRRQLQLYRALAGERFGASSLDLWYPRAENSWIRRVEEPSPDDMREMLEVRNEAVRLITDLASRDRVWDLLSSAASDPDIWFKGEEERARLAFDNELRSCGSTVRSYVEFMVSFIARTMLAARIGWYSTSRNTSLSDIWRSDPEEKMEKGVLLDSLSLSSIEYSNGKWTLLLDDLSDAREFKFRENDLVILYPKPHVAMDMPSVLIDGYLMRQTFKKEYDDGASLFPPVTIEVEVNSYVPEIETWREALTNGEPPPIFCMERYYSEKIHKSQFQGIFHLLVTMGGRLKRVLLGAEAPSKPDSDDVVEAASDSDPLFLIQGPPGSGKTRHFIPKLVRRCLEKRPDEQILIVAMSNQAVGEIAGALADEFKDDAAHMCDFIQIGTDPEASADWAPKHSLRRILKNASELPDLERFDKMRDVFNRLLSASVLITTTASADEKLFHFRANGTLIVDEASQIHECQLLTVLAYSKRAIIIGDQKQLPPVHEVELKADMLPEEIAEIGFAERPGASIMERLWRLARHKKWDWITRTLPRQYRMHEEIQDFVNRRYYGNKLSCGSGWQSQKKFIFHKDVDSSIFKGSRALLADRLKRNRRIWIQVSGGDENIQRERENEVIMDLLGILHRDSIAIGVVMPFRKQIQRLRNSLEREYARKDLPIPDSIRIDTVERFQGGQRDVVIIAAGICDASTIEILQSIMPADPQIDEPEVDCKLNVALTRAREQVIVVGNPGALCCSPHYGALYDSIGEKLEYEFSGGSGRYAEPTGW